MFADSSKSLVDVLKEFNEGGVLAQYKSDGVRTFVTPLKLQTVIIM